MAISHVFSYLQGATFAQYDAAYNNLMPQVRAAATSYALARLTEITRDIDSVLKELKVPGVRESLGRIAQKIQTEHAAEWPALTGSALPNDIVAVNTRHRGSPDASWSPKRLYDYSQDLTAVTKGRTREVRARVGATVKSEAKIQQAGQLLAIIFYGRRGPQILSRLSRDAEEGVAMAEQVFTEACNGAQELAQTIATDLQSVWRYPTFIAGGLDQLGLLDERGGKLAYPGLLDYTVEIGALLGETPLERILPVLGGALFVFGLVLPGGLLIEAISVAISAVSVSVNIARKREQELAAQASEVLPEDEGFAEHPEWGSVALETAFLLVSAISFFRRGVAALPRSRGERTPTPISSTPQPPPGGQPSKLTNSRSGTAPPSGSPSGTLPPRSGYTSGTAPGAPGATSSTLTVNPPAAPAPTDPVGKPSIAPPPARPPRRINVPSAFSQLSPAEQAARRAEIAASGGTQGSRGTERPLSGREQDAANRKEALEWARMPGVTTETRFFRNDQHMRSIAGTIKEKAKELAKKGMGHLLRAADPDEIEKLLTTPLDLFIEQDDVLRPMLANLRKAATQNPEIKDALERMLKETGIGASNVSSLRSDIVEFRLVTGEIVIFDHTRYTRLVHQFKTRLYARVVERMLSPGSNVRVYSVEFEHEGKRILTNLVEE